MRLRKRINELAHEISELKRKIDSLIDENIILKKRIKALDNPAKYKRKDIVGNLIIERVNEGSSITTYSVFSKKGRMSIYTEDELDLIKELSEGSGK